MIVLLEVFEEGEAGRRERRRRSHCLALPAARNHSARRDTAGAWRLPKIEV